MIGKGLGWNYVGFRMRGIGLGKFDLMWRVWIWGDGLGFGLVWVCFLWFGSVYLFFYLRYCIGFII